MSISDFFNKKIVTQSSLEETTSSVESPDLIKEISKRNQTFFPNVNFSDPSNFVHFGSAKEYYEGSIKRIYESYPYDGSEAEKMVFDNKSTYLDQWLLDNKYPKSTGYALFSADGWGSAASTVGQYAVPANKEYIYSAGGMHSASLTQHENQDDPIGNHALKDVFDLGVKYDSAKNRTINYRMKMDDGVTIQFWLKKDAFTTVTDKEVVLDLWNGVIDSGSHDYGRLTLERSGGASLSTTGSVFYLTLRSGSYGIINRAICVPSYNAASISNGTWQHHTVTVKAASTNLDVKYYNNGLLNLARTFPTTVTLADVPNNINAYIGALQTSSYGDTYDDDIMVGAGKLSGSIDDFRFWKKSLDNEYVYNTWYYPVGGGANTDDYRTSLGVYYKFNEGITGTSSLDSMVLDYSGRIANGLWIKEAGYISSVCRNTGSAFASASVLTEEPGDPIIRSTHSSVQSLLTEMQTSGSDYDRTNSSYIYNSLPTWIREEDEANDNIKYLYQILGSYLDTLYVQISELPKLKDKNYFSASAEPYPFTERLLNDRGLLTPNSFIAGDVMEYFWDRNKHGVHYEQTIEKTKRLIYNNIYNNIDFILKSKGTEKSFRNLLRCYGIDDELVKLNVYTDNGKHYLTDRYKNSSVKTKVLDLNKASRVNASVTQTSSSLNALTFISGSGDELNEKFSAFSFEAGITFPRKPSFGETGYFSDTSLSSSLFGFHQAVSGTNAHYGWNTPDDANLQVYAVKAALDSERVKFVVTNTDASIYAESGYYEEVYTAERWNFQLSVRPTGYPFNGSATHLSNPTYDVELYGVTHNLGDIRNEFLINNVATYAKGVQIMTQPKRVYIGAHINDFTGSALAPSDVLFDSCRVWMDKLENESIRQHNLDPMNYGHDKIYNATTLFNVTLSSSVHIPGADSLILHWNFDQNTTANATGSFFVEDFSSGSTSNLYGWASNIIERENKGYGVGFPNSDPNPVRSEFIFARRKELPEMSFTDNRITIIGDKEEFFIEDDDTTDNVFALEKSMYQVMSEEMLRTFATMKEYSNLFSKPVDLYRTEYKRLRKARELFFNRVEANPDLDRYVDYYKWIDSSLSFFLEQLKPASVTFTKGISDIVESHIFERPKYDRKFPTVKTIQATQGVVKSIGELGYNWKFGHAPLQTFATATITFSDVDGGSIGYGQTITIISTDGTSKTYTARSTSDYAANEFDADGGFDDKATALKGAIEHASGHNGKITVTQGGGGNNVLTLRQAQPGSSGNTIITENVTDCTVTSFIGGDSKENNHCLWQRERKERFGTNTTQRQSIIDVMNTNAQSYNVYLGDNEKNVYLRPTYVTKRFSKPYKLSYELKSTIHGGINYNQQKNRDFVFNVTRPHGAKTNMGIPVSVFAIGVGPAQGITDTRLCYDEETPNRLHKFGFTMIAGKDASGDGTQPATASLDYAFRVKGHYGSPFNIVSGTMAFGANKKVNNNYKSDAIITNIHSDTTYFENDIPMQGPFTETWVGGHQSRHVEINRFDTTKVTEGGGATTNNLDDNYSRPEAWRLIFGDHPDEVAQDGAFGIVGADYGGPYPDPSRKFAIYYRGLRTKRPYSVGNVSGSDYRLGNYKERYEYFNSVGRLENNTRLKKSPTAGDYEISGTFLPASISSVLPATTHPVTLIAQEQTANGNVFGTHLNSRQPDGQDGSLKGGQPQIGFRVKQRSAITNGHLLQLTGGAINALMEADTDGSVRNDTTILLETYRKALKFNGTSDIQIANFAFNSVTNQDFSVSLWFKNTDSDSSINSEIQFRDGSQIAHFIKFQDDVTIQFENAATTADVASFNTNTGTVLGNTWIHFIATFEVSSLGSGVPKLFMNGSSVSSTGFSAIGGTTPTIDRLVMFFDREVQVQDLTIWKTPMTGSGAIAELYNSGNWKDPITHTSASAISNHWKFGEEDYWPAFPYMVGDTMDVSSNTTAIISSSYGTNPHVLSISPADLEHVEFTVGKGNKTNAEMWNFLTASINRSFPIWEATYTDETTYAQFLLKTQGPAAIETPIGITTSGTSYTNLTTVSASAIAKDVVIERESDYLTGSTRNRTVITSRFSAPGGIEVQSYGYLDAYAREYSVHNSLNYRNLSVRGSGSGELGTIRVDSHISSRDGLRALYQRPMGRAGTDSVYGSVDQTDYIYNASFHKIPRNSQAAIEYQISRAILFHAPLDSYTGDSYAYVAQTGYKSNLPISFSGWAFFSTVEGSGPPFGYLFKFHDETQGSGELPSYEAYFANSGIYGFAYGDGGEINLWSWSWATLGVDDTYFENWNHIVITWNGVIANAPHLHLNGGAAIAAVYDVNNGGNRREMTQLTIGDTKGGGGEEISMQEIAFWDVKLNQEDAAELYGTGDYFNTSLANSSSAILDYWEFGEDFAGTVSGSVLLEGTRLQPVVGPNALYIYGNAYIVNGFHEKGLRIINRNNNYNYQSAIPSSDYNYSWATSSLGDNYSVRSGNQKIYGYWPKDGLNRVNGVLDSAITFPTASEIYGE